MELAMSNRNTKICIESVYVMKDSHRQKQKKFCLGKK